MTILKKINALSLRLLSLAGVLAVASLAVDVISAGAMYIIELTRKPNDVNSTD